MSSGRNNKVRSYPRFSQINIGLIIFALLLVYLIAVFVAYLRTDKVTGYQVLEGSLSSDNIYQGIAIRKESVHTSPLAGYVNYFATEGDRVAVGNLVYTVDESGNLLDYLQAEGAGSFTMSPEDLTELRTQIVNFEATFDEKSFHTVYEFKNALSGTVSKLTSAGILENIASLNAASQAQTISYQNADETGIVVYSFDGFEDLTLQGITAKTFEEANYAKTQMVNNTLVEPGEAVYKVCTDDNWSIVIPVDEEKADMLVDLDYIRVRFLKNQDISWAKVNKYVNGEGEVFAELSFNNAMHTFCTDRFINVELLLTEERGLKIPVSSIVNRRFFVVPKDFVLSGSLDAAQVIRRTFTEDGEATSETVDVTVYNETETHYYLDDLSLSVGDTLLKEEEEATFTVGTQESLVGVFNINKGYADFKQIRILYQNEEYAIVESNTRYGLNAYDYIVLDAESVNENDMVYN